MPEETIHGERLGTIVKVNPLWDAGVVKVSICVVSEVARPRRQTFKSIRMGIVIHEN